jgi:hypothetical protein
MSTLNTRVLAGVTVPDTPLITKAIDYAQKHSNDVTYNHVMRSWLLGTFIADRIPHLQGRDKEAHSIAAMFHDLGWSTTPELISSDKRFEVDGANAAKNFILAEGARAEWDRHRVQLVWDAIALHATRSIAIHKEIEVQSCYFGISADFVGPEMAQGGVLTREVWNSIAAVYPRSGLKEGVKEILCGLCKTKPMTTYDNWVGDWGVRFIPGYNRDENSALNRVLSAEE